MCVGGMLGSTASASRAAQVAAGVLFEVLRDRSHVSGNAPKTRTDFSRTIRQGVPAHRNPLAWIVMTIAARGDRSSLSIACSSFLESANADRRDQAGQKDSTESNRYSNQAGGEAHRDQIPKPDG
jgi:hypothetical protein